MYPQPPMVWMARSVVRTASSLAASFDIEPSPRSNATPVAAIQDARQVSNRAASRPVARSASGNAMPWLSMMGAPNASRRLAYSVTYSNAARAMPRACAATMGRVCSNVPSVADPDRLGPPSRTRASRRSSFSCPPSRWSAGTRTPLNFSSAVCDARQPSLSSLRTISRPGRPPGTMNRPCPRCPSSSSTTALTTCTLAMPPFPIHILCPSMIQSASGPEPSRRALVRRLRTSLPPSGSEIASAASFRSPGVPKHSGAHCSICSGVAACPMADSASAGITTANPIPAQPQNSSSMNIGRDSPVGSPIRSR